MSHYTNAYAASDGDDDDDGGDERHLATACDTLKHIFNIETFESTLTKLNVTLPWQSFGLLSVQGVVSKVPLRQGVLHAVELYDLGDLRPSAPPEPEGRPEAETLSVVYCDNMVTMTTAASDIFRRFLTMFISGSAINETKTSTRHRYVRGTTSSGG